MGELESGGTTAATDAALGASAVDVRLWEASYWAADWHGGRWWTGVTGAHGVAESQLNSAAALTAEVGVYEAVFEGPAISISGKTSPGRVCR